jgi:hypothetical protein
MTRRIAFTRILTPPIENTHVLMGVLLNQPSLTDRIDIEPSVTLSAKKPTLSASSCAPST